MGQHAKRRVERGALTRGLGGQILVSNMTKDLLSHSQITYDMDPEQNLLREIPDCMRGLIIVKPYLSIIDNRGKERGSL